MANMRNSKEHFVSIWLLIVLCSWAWKKTGAADGQATENENDVSILEELQGQIFELKTLRLRDKIKFENEIKSLRTFFQNEVSKIQNFDRLRSNFAEKSEIQSLNTKIENLTTKILTIEGELKPDTWIIQPLIGPPGPPGEKGQIGSPGVKGEEGTPGQNGQNGSPGPSGGKGEKGDRGMEGPQGQEGRIGLKGDPGVPGSKGENGITGVPGRNGEKGEKGDAGLPGGIPMDDLVSINQTLKLLTNFALGYAKSCSEIDKSWTSESKHKIYPNGRDQPGVEVLCDLQTEGGGWTFIQKRSSGPKEEFYRNWAEYENGFGSVDGNFWIGLKNIHALTKDRDQELRVDLWDFEGDHVYAKYSHFSISDAVDFYRLSISGYSGNAGDNFTPSDSYMNQNGMRFSTKDKDNDNDPSYHCAEERKGAWWYNKCGSSLNGLYYQKGDVSSAGGSGISWYYWRNSWRSLRQAQMKIRRRK